MLVTTSSSCFGDMTFAQGGPHLVVVCSQVAQHGWKLRLLQVKELVQHIRERSVRVGMLVLVFLQSVSAVSALYVQRDLLYFEVLLNARLVFTPGLLYSLFQLSSGVSVGCASPDLKSSVSCLQKTLYLTIQPWILVEEHFNTHCFCALKRCTLLILLPV